MTLGRYCSAIAVVAALAAPASAHHSFAMFDAEKTVTVTGTVKEFEWTNPHGWMHLVIAGADGKMENWAFEMGSVTQLAEEGWKPDIVKPGDKLTMTMHPLKDGSRGGQYLTATISDGRSFTVTRGVRGGGNNARGGAGNNARGGGGNNPQQ